MKSSLRYVRPLLFILVSLALSGCLKTRAQVKDDQPDEGAAETPSQPKSVQHEGDYVLDEIKTEITRLNGRIEDLERSQKENSTLGPTKDEIKKLDDRMAELEKAQADMIEALKKVQTTQLSTGDASGLLEKGRKHLEAKEYDAAVTSFNAFVKSNPRKSGDEGHFLLGEAYYGNKDYKKAIVSYSKLTEKYTRSALMPSALLKIALSFEAMGMKDDAKAFYQELTDKFPKSPEARRAQNKTP